MVKDDELMKYVISDTFDTDFERFDFKKWVYHHLEEFEPHDLAITMKKVVCHYIFRKGCNNPRPKSMQIVITN